MFVEINYSGNSFSYIFRIIFNQLIVNTKIYKELINPLKSSSKKTNSSIIELCLTELATGDYKKATDLSEELIKKDVDDSVGWALKSIYQTYLFDYDQNLNLLKSSISSLEEFNNKTKLNKNDLLQVEGVFTTSVLNRSMELLNKKIEDVVELRKKAAAEKSKAQAAALAAAACLRRITIKVKYWSILGYAGAAGAVGVSAKYSENSDLLNEASKGVFGAAIGNIVLTIDYAKNLKINLDKLTPAVKEEAVLTLKNWIITLAELYSQVIENLIIYAKEVKGKNTFSKSFKSLSLNFIDSHEASQFIYLSKMLGTDKSMSGFKEIEETFNNLKKVNLNELKSSIRQMHFIAAGALVAGYLISASGYPQIAQFPLLAGIGLYIYFRYKPTGTAGDVKKMVNEIITQTEKFDKDNNGLSIERLNT